MMVRSSGGTTHPQCIRAKAVGTPAVTVASLLKRVMIRSAGFPTASLGPCPPILLPCPFLCGCFGGGMRVPGVWHHPQP